MKTEFRDYLLNVDRFRSRKLILENKDKIDVIEEIIVPVLEEIGNGWQSGIYSLSQVYMSSVICEELSLEIFGKEKKETEKHSNIAIVTFDDYHTFGKKLVKLSLLSSGYEVVDFGQIFDENELIQKVVENEIDILLMSVLMLPPALKIKDLKPKLLEANPNIKVIVGGAPFRFDKNLYKELGADASGESAHDAIRLIKEMEEKS